jgi:hypothetical protein
MVVAFLSFELYPAGEGKTHRQRFQIQVERFITKGCAEILTHNQAVGGNMQ